MLNAVLMPIYKSNGFPALRMELFAVVVFIVFGVANDGCAVGAEANAPAIVHELTSSNSKKSAALSENDTEVLSQFQNRTNDITFDHSLSQASAAEFEQSPFLNILPESKVRKTLLAMAP